MSATKAPPARSRTAGPVLENFYNLKQATVRLGLATEDENDKRGQDWLRRGVNRKPGQGPKFPCYRMANQLMFSDSDLAEIAELVRNKVDGRSKPRASRRKRPIAR
ncbi:MULTISPECIES: hypothetical protein [Streptomyces]|jgi:hypothetical protein|uniref:Uncharacterized protein n=1 Tax=Streptomyces stelliscabiei TaxID=146820 RepID=A0A8I0P9U8_9ACTN|nr:MULTISPECIES: hypothetical protein [Streptomyces]KND29664.1 hypothetical protein IQ64_41950 [Streptomyces stelliscabiei]MBE1599754.1 hypothetical protein [Streptomyces stelliscabiei]MDX2519411.1 hypothetical protein [Streptomyces stelliscabiei]MDX2549660.1 hypothetical protein [Streptomyces stelliscabiei]MDX2616090.1 hypothetical protein [Streptomyces stelliscabiei]